MYVILVYDIVQDESSAKAARRIFKTCKKYLTHIQKSVFEGEISRGMLEKLRMELEKNVRKDRDSILIFKGRDEKWLKKEFWGKEDDKTSNFF